MVEGREGTEKRRHTTRDKCIEFETWFSCLVEGVRGMARERMSYDAPEMRLINIRKQID